MIPKCYFKFSQIKGLHPKKAIQLAQNTAIALLKNNTTIDQLTATIIVCVEKEQFETAEGIKLAINQFINSKNKSAIT